MTAYKPNRSERALIAVDIAKYRNEVLVEVPGKRRRLTILNNRADHGRLVAVLAGLGCPAVVGFKATGNYHRPLAFRLLTEGFDL